MKAHRLLYHATLGLGVIEKKRRSKTAKVNGACQKRRHVRGPRKAACLWYSTVLCRERKEQLERFEGLSPESQCQNLALTVLDVPYSLDSGRRKVSDYMGTSLMRKCTPLGPFRGPMPTVLGAS